MPIKLSSDNTSNRKLRSGCGESLQSSLCDELVRSAEKVARQDNVKTADKDASQIILNGEQNYSDE